MKERMIRVEDVRFEEAEVFSRQAEELHES